MKTKIIFILLLLCIKYVEAQTVNTWQPTSGFDWHEVNNWSLGHVPTSVEHVMITSSLVEINQDAHINSIFISQYATVINNSTLTINGDSPSQIKFDLSSYSSFINSGNLSIANISSNDSIGIRSFGQITSLSTSNISVIMNTGIGYENNNTGSTTSDPTGTFLNNGTALITAHTPILNKGYIELNKSISTSSTNSGYHIINSGNKSEYIINLDLTFYGSTHPYMLIEQGATLELSENKTLTVYASNPGTIKLDNGSIVSDGTLKFTFENTINQSWNSVFTNPIPIEYPNGNIYYPKGTINNLTNGKIFLEASARADINNFNLLKVKAKSDDYHFTKYINDLNSFTNSEIHMDVTYTGTSTYTYENLVAKECDINKDAHVYLFIKNPIFNYVNGDYFDLITYDTLISQSLDNQAYNEILLQLTVSDHFGKHIFKMYKKGDTPPPCGQIVYPLDGATGIPIDATIRWNKVPGALGYLVGTFRDDNIVKFYDVVEDTTLTTIKPFYHYSQNQVTIRSYGINGDQTVCDTFSFQAIDPPSVTPPCTNILYPNANGITVDPNLTVKWKPVAGHPFYKLQLVTINEAGTSASSIVTKYIDYDTTYTHSFQKNKNIELYLDPYYDSANIPTCDSKDKRVKTGNCNSLNLKMWEGDENNNWDNVLNWNSFLAKPNECSDVVIFSPATVEIEAGNAAIAHSLTILGGLDTKLTINGSLTIENATNKNALSNFGDVLISGTGTLNVKNLINGSNISTQAAINNNGKLVNNGIINILKFVQQGIYNYPPVINSSYDPTLPPDRYFENNGTININYDGSNFSNGGYSGIRNITTFTNKANGIINIDNVTKPIDMLDATFGIINNLGSIHIY